MNNIATIPLALLMFFFLAALTMPNSAQSDTYYPFPDTGQTMCYDADNNEVSCDSIVPGDQYYGQDGHYQPMLPRSFTKLEKNDEELPDDELHEDDGGRWIMTRDNVTGLIWEVKTNANKDDKYNWQGAQSQFIAGLNNDEFGGFENWRLPSRQELASLVNKGDRDPAINTDFFPNTRSSFYWSSTSKVPTTGLSGWIVYFQSGGVIPGDKTKSYYVRAVREGQSSSGNFVDNPGGTVTDTATGLMWQKCTYDTTWDIYKEECTGSAIHRTWQQALEASENLELAGYDDWRLPNINELLTLVDDTTYRPAIDKDFFPDTKTNLYWSSTTNVSSKDASWYVEFDHGSTGSMRKSESYKNYVRAVRGGQVASTYTLAVNSTGASGVNITANPNTYGGTTDYTHTNIPGKTEITLTAPTTKDNENFTSWIGCDSWSWEHQSCMVTMNNNKTVTVRYGADSPKALSGVLMLLLDEED